MSMYERAEVLERDGWKSEEPQPAALARLLAERGLKREEAVRLAMQAASSRADIATMDALAWACFQAGRLQEAKAASERARRTGTADRRVLYHAAAIEYALGNDHDARRLLSRALDGNPRFDLIAAPAALALARESGAS
jgi:tetratricopeptide (TPR) repeat protein